MPQFEHNGVCVSVVPFPVTLRNNETAREWLTKVDELARRESIHAQETNIIKAVNNWPEILQFLNSNGELNKVTVQHNVEAIKQQIVMDWDYEETPVEERIMPSDEDVQKMAEARVLEGFQKLLLSNVEIAKVIHFSGVLYPETITALTLGIDCIKATYDKNKADETTRAFIDSAINSDFWQARTASEVADYVNLFREQFK